MSRLQDFWKNFGNMDDRKFLKLFVALVAAYVLMTAMDVINAWNRKYSLELESASFQHQEERRKFDLAAERDRITLAKERRDAGIDNGSSTQILKELGEIFLRVGPYALLFFSLAQAWKVFEDQRSSRLRLALSVAFSVVVVGFVLIVGGYVTPTSLKVGAGRQQIEMTSESLGAIVVAIGAILFLASLASLRPKHEERADDEA